MKIADLAFLERIERLPSRLDGKGWFVVKRNGRKYLLRRIGKCEPKKCRSMCCRKFVIQNSNRTLQSARYVSFMFSTKGNVVINQRCSQLNKNGLCNVWKNKLPDACKDFPFPTDCAYHEMCHKCSFKFDIYGEIKDV